MLSRYVPWYVLYLDVHVGSKTMQKLESNLWRYRLYLALLFTPIFLPTLVLFWKQNGLDMFDVFLLQGLFAIAVVILEVPTGMVADQLGKRTSLLAGTALFTIGHIVYALGYSFLVFLLAELIMALGLALVSGADSAFLYDTLQALDRKDEYTEVEGHARSWQMVSIAASNIIGGIVGSYSYRATVWLSIIGPALAMILAFQFVEPKLAKSDSQENKALGSFREEWSKYWKLLLSALKFVRKHQLVRWYILLFAMLGGSATWLLWLYQPYMKATGLPVWAFGVAFALFNLWAALSSRFAHAVVRKLGDVGTFVIAMILQIGTLFVMAVWFHRLSFLLILGHQSVRGMLRPVLNERILRYTYEDRRATVLSLNSLGSRLFFALTAPWIGMLSARASLSQTLVVQGAGLSILVVLLVVLFRTIPSKYFQVKESVASD